MTQPRATDEAIDALLQSVNDLVDSPDGQEESLADVQPDLLRMLHTVVHGYAEAVVKCDELATRVTRLEHQVAALRTRYPS